MVSDYLTRLLLLLPLVCALVVAALFVMKRFYARPMGLGGAQRSARLTETLFLGPGARLAVVEFADRRLLLAVTKQGVSLLTEAGPKRDGE